MITLVFHNFYLHVYVKHLVRNEFIDYILLTKMTDYMIVARKDILFEQAEKCPYRFENKEAEHMVSMIWATWTATLPNSNVRIVDDYAEKYVDDPIFAAKLRRATTIHAGKFHMLESKEKNRFVIQSVKDGTIYNVVAGPHGSSLLEHVDEFSGMIHSWNEDGSYNVATVFDVPRHTTNQNP